MGRDRCIEEFFNHAAERLIGFRVEEALWWICYNVLRSNLCQTQWPLDVVCQSREASAPGCARQTPNPPPGMARGLPFRLRPKNAPLSWKPLWIGMILCLMWEIGTGPAGVRAESSVDHSIYADLLNRYVHDGLVDYGGLKAEEDRLDRYLSVLEHVNTASLSKNERLAFYINAYNAWTIKLILGAYPNVRSIKDLGSLFRSPWKEKIARIDGKVLTLDEIEHGIIRPQFKDPRIHFAVNCASKSCPPLHSEPYRGADLHGQLDEAARRFINDPRSTVLRDQTLHVSKIFDWYSKDFGGDSVGFILKYADKALKEKIETVPLIPAV